MIILHKAMYIAKTIRDRQLKQRKIVQYPYLYNICEDESHP